jgi:hypothetical protein
MIRGVLACLVAGLAGLAAAACGASKPALEAGVYRSGDVAFHVGDVPPAWRPVHVQGATLAWRDEAARASVLLDARCHETDDDVPLRALTMHLLMGTTERDVKSEETLPFDGREALHTRLSAKLDGVPMDYDVYVVKKDGCVYDFVLVREPDAPDSSPAFERVVQSFHTVPGGGA